MFTVDRFFYNAWFSHGLFRSFFSLRFLYTISKLWEFLNISHLSDCKRLIKIHSFFVNSEVRNVEICTYFLESAKKMPV